MKKTMIAPSLLSASFSRLESEIRDIEKGGADWLHLDVMDGHFVPNLTFGPMLVKDVSKVTHLPLDCHLMVTHPGQWSEAFADAGAEVITIHQEACSHLDRELRRIKKLGCKAGVSINPATPVSVLENVLDIVDLVLIMSVNPGFGGQSFIETSYKKIQKLVKMRADRAFLIEVDGGVDPKNAGKLVAAGADVLVAGSAVFGQKNRKKAIQALRKK